MNKKGMIGIVSYFFGLMIFMYLWAFWLGSFLNEWAAQTIATNSYAGLTAFFISNINLWIFFGLLLSTGLVIYFGGQE